MNTKNHAITQKRRKDPLSAIALLSRCSKSQLQDNHIQGVLLAYHGALTGLCTGYGTKKLWETAAYSLNMALILAEIGVKPEGMNIIQDAQAAMLRVQSMALTNGEWKLGTSAFIINCAFKIHDDQIKIATINQIRFAQNEIRRRENSGDCL